MKPDVRLVGRATALLDGHNVQKARCMVCKELCYVTVTLDPRSQFVCSTTCMSRVVRKGGRWKVRR